MRVTRWEEVEWPCGCVGGRPVGRMAWMLMSRCAEHADVRFELANDTTLFGSRDGARVELPLGEHRPHRHHQGEAPA